MATDNKGFALPRRCRECGERPTYRKDGKMRCYDCGATW